MNKYMIALIAVPAILASSALIESPVSASTEDVYVPQTDAQLEAMFTFTMIPGGYSIAKKVAGNTEIAYVPKYYKGEKVIEVSAKGFISSRSSKIIFEDSSAILRIGDEAFDSSAATNSISLPNITAVPREAFNASKFKEIHLNGRKISSIGISSFASINISNEMSFESLTEIPEKAFISAIIPKIKFNQNRIKSIGPYAFSSSTIIDKLKFEHLTLLGGSAFYSSSFKEVIINSIDSLLGVNHFALMEGSPAIYVPSMDVTVTNAKKVTVTAIPNILGYELIYSGFFNQGKKVLTPLQDGLPHPTKQPIVIDDYNKILKGGEDIEFNTEYSLQLYPRKESPNTPYGSPIILPKLYESYADTVEVIVKQGGLGLQMIDPQDMKVYIDLTTGKKESEIEVTSSMRVNDFRSKDDPWTLSLATTKLSAGGEPIDGASVTAEGLSINKVLDTKFIDGKTTYEYENLYDDQNKIIPLSESPTAIHVAGEFGAYDHKFNKLKISVDPRKIYFADEQAEVTLETTLIWTLATEV